MISWLMTVSRQVYRYGHINVSTFYDPYQAHTSGGPIWIFLSLKDMAKTRGMTVSDFSIFVSFGV